MKPRIAWRPWAWPVKTDHIVLCPDNMLPLGAFEVIIPEPSGRTYSPPLASIPEATAWLVEVLIKNRNQSQKLRN